MGGIIAAFSASAFLLFCFGWVFNIICLYGNIAFGWLSDFFFCAFLALGFCMSRRSLHAGNKSSLLSGNVTCFSLGSASTLLCLAWLGLTLLGWGQSKSVAEVER